VLVQRSRRRSRRRRRCRRRRRRRRRRRHRPCTSHCRRCSHIANRAHERAYIVKNVLKIEHYVITVENDWSSLKFKPSLSVKCQSTNQ